MRFVSCVSGLIGQLSGLYKYLMYSCSAVCTLVWTVSRERPSSACPFHRDRIWELFSATPASRRTPPIVECDAVQVAASQVLRMTMSALLIIVEPVCVESGGRGGSSSSGVPGAGGELALVSAGGGGGSAQTPCPLDINKCS